VYFVFTELANVHIYTIQSSPINLDKDRR